MTKRKVKGRYMIAERGNRYHTLGKHGFDYEVIAPDHEGAPIMIAGCPTKKDAERIINALKVSEREVVYYQEY
jgi:hypothetical protein